MIANFYHLTDSLFGRERDDSSINVHTVIK